MNSPEFPTPWQKKSIWTALTTLSVVAIGAIAVGLIWLFSSVVAYLQPILTPFAIAGVLAYLLEPVVAKIVSWGTSRKRAASAVLAVVVIALTGVLICLIPAIWNQTANLARRIPGIAERGIHMVDEFNGWARGWEEKTGIHFLPPVPKKLESPEQPAPDNSTPSPAPSAAATPTPAAPPSAPPANRTATPPSAAPAPPTEAPTPAAPDANFTAATSDSTPPSLDFSTIFQGDWFRTAGPVLLRNAWAFFMKSTGGFLGVFGPLLSLIIVPIYLLTLLPHRSSRKISPNRGAITCPCAPRPLRMKSLPRSKRSTATSSHSSADNCS